VEVVGVTRSLEEATGCVEFKLTVVLASIYPHVDGVDRFGVSREKSRSDEGEGGVVQDTVHSTLETVLASGSEIVPSTTVPVAVFHELPSHQLNQLPEYRERHTPWKRVSLKEWTSPPS
jgi:hypothetical protein